MKLIVALCGGASLLAMAPAAFAQTADQSTATADQTIVVTGTRIVQNGYAAPTPVTVAPADQLNKFTPTDIPDALNKLPVFDGSTLASAGAAGTAVPGSFLNLRDFGINRTLVLMDGLRVPPTNFNGQVDANTLPEMLLQRVDIVTGGASAVYGSDAVSGVVNFIMDTHFNGLKAQVDTGISQDGDSDSTRYGIAAGTDFLNLGHFEGSFEHFQEGGLLHDQRPFGQPTADTVYTGAGTAASPYVLTNYPTVPKTAFGGLVLTGPFAGQQFLNNGQLGDYTPGATTGSANVTVGGNAAYYNDNPLTAPQDMNQFYGRFDRDLTNDIHFFVQAMGAQSQASEHASNWPAQTVTYYSGNPFLPAAAQAQLTATGTASFTAAMLPRDLTLMSQQTDMSDSISVTAGLDGKLFDNYKWDLSYTHGESIFRQRLSDNINVPNFLAAVDAVTGPNGTPVCRVSTTANAALYPGCVPLNLFGEGNESAAAEAYIFQTTQWKLANSMDDYVASIAGSPVSDWAGPVSVALNAEYRQQGLQETTNANPLTPPTNDSSAILRNVTTAPTSVYAYATVAPNSATNNVWEVAAETVVPLVKDLPLIKSFDISGAVRYTDYSSSGAVETWKAGLDYQPVSDIRIRATESRDIRAPTLYDLYQGESSVIQNLNDPISGKSQVVTIYTLGNPNLVPEVALTTTAGVVYSPSWLPHFRMSVDYYNMNVNNAIISLAGNNATFLQQCAATPNQPLCGQLIVRSSPTAFPTAVYTQSVNAAKNWTDGVDVEASYNTPLSEIYHPLLGNVTARLLYNYQPTLDIQNFPGAVVTNEAGEAGVSVHRLTVMLGYNFGPVSLDWQTRYYSSQARGTPQQVFANGPLPAYSLSDVNLNYRFNVDGHTFDAFFNVQNLFNTPPDISPSITLSGIPGFGSPALAGDDMIGRYFTAGMKFRY